MKPPTAVRFRNHSLTRPRRRLYQFTQRTFSANLAVVFAHCRAYICLLTSVGCDTLDKTRRQPIVPKKQGGGEGRGERGRKEIRGKGRGGEGGGGGGKGEGRGGGKWEGAAKRGAGDPEVLSCRWVERFAGHKNIHFRGDASLNSGFCVRTTWEAVARSGPFAQRQAASNPTADGIGNLPSRKFFLDENNQPETVTTSFPIATGGHGRRHIIEAVDAHPD